MIDHRNFQCLLLIPCTTSYAGLLLLSFTFRNCCAFCSPVKMRKAALCFSMLQFPRHRIHTLANSLCGSFPSIGKSGGDTSSSKILCSGNYGAPGRQCRRMSRQTITSKPDGRKKEYESSKTLIQNLLLDETASTTVNLHKPEIYVPERTKLLDIQQLIDEKKDLSELATFIAFDIETTGFCRTTDRIIEIAMRDLRGGDNSVFQTLVNPECYVPNANIHGISNHMVNRHDVPRYSIIYIIASFCAIVYC